jgi:NADPH:quinone reductase-like Zn-dependent oxidoreductase
MVGLMKAMALEAYKQPLKMMELPKPQPAKGELLIRVAYAGVNPADWKITEGYFAERMPTQFPLIPGWDVAGVVEAVGEGVDAKRIGESVFAYVRKPVAQWGSYAEYVTFDAQQVAPIPKSLTLREAAGVPLAALTAWQSVVEWGQVGKGEQVLIHAGAGGVGGFAIQMAHHFGAQVTTTASKRHHDYVKGLGADRVIDYTQEQVSGQFDLIFDTVGGATFEQAWSLLRRGGKLVSILAPIDEARAKAAGIQGKYVFVRPEGSQLRQIAQLFDDGSFKAPTIRDFPLSQANEAFALLREGHTQGKLVLEISG